jgi:hypothetical protein
MSKQIKARPMNRTTDVRTGARQVLLAGIGAASLLRKNAGKSWAEATAIASRMPEATSILIEGLGERSQAFREDLIVRAENLGKRAKVATTNLVADVELRVQPVLRKLAETKIGLGIVISKPKAKRAPGKKAVHKAAKPVAKRTVRKARKAA